MSSPSSRIHPARTRFSSPTAARSSVVLPAPLWPITAATPSGGHLDRDAVDHRACGRSRPRCRCSLRAFRPPPSEHRRDLVLGVVPAARGRPPAPCGSACTCGDRALARAPCPRAAPSREVGERPHEVHVVLDDDDGALRGDALQQLARSRRVSSALIPATGSSSSSSFASCTSSMPISSHCFWPCGRMPAGVSTRSVSPIVSSASSIAGRRRDRRRSSVSAPRRRPAAMSRFCSTVSSSNTLAVWNVRPTPSRAIWCTFLPSSSCPPNCRRPGGLRPAR